MKTTIDLPHLSEAKSVIGVMADGKRVEIVSVEIEHRFFRGQNVAMAARLTLDGKAGNTAKSLLVVNGQQGVYRVQPIDAERQLAFDKTPEALAEHRAKTRQAFTRMRAKTNAPAADKAH